MKKIALEEHFVTPDLVGYGTSTSSIAQPQAWADASRRLLDFTEERLPEMDLHGIDMEVLSLNSPGIQAETDPTTAIAKTKTVNDFLAGIMTERPTRFSGFAALPLQDPQAAAKELERAVTELGMKGALVNAHTNGMYLDDPKLRVVWEMAEGLDVPLYLHPANGVDTAHVLDGHPELVGPMWSWGIDTSTHALRLIFGGVFDDFPNAKLLLGHMGEGLPYALWRLDSRWDFHNHHGIELAKGKPSEYLRRQPLHHHQRRLLPRTPALRNPRRRRRTHPLRNRLPVRDHRRRRQIPRQRTHQRSRPRKDQLPQRRKTTTPGKNRRRPAGLASASR